MGHSFYSPVSKITGDSLKSFREKLYVGSNITLVGVNVGLDELKASAEPLFAGAASGSAAAAAASPYLGGELRMKADSPYTYLALAHEVADPAAAAALKAILDAKLRGSPLSAAPFAAAYAGTGLVGLCGVCVPGAAPQALDGLRSALAGLGALAAEDVALGEAAAALQARMALECARAAPAALVAPAAAGGPVDVRAAAAKLLGSPAALASLGDVSSVPRL